MRTRSTDVGDHDATRPFGSPAVVCRAQLAARRWRRARSRAADRRSRRRSSKRDGVHAGQPVRAALQVALPEGLHVQLEQAARSDSHPDRSLHVDAPAGVTVDEIVFPEADRSQAGGRRPAARGLRARLRRSACSSTSPPTCRRARSRVPARLRYQACDDTMCYFPRRR